MFVPIFSSLLFSASRPKRLLSGPAWFCKLHLGVSARRFLPHRKQLHGFLSILRPQWKLDQNQNFLLFCGLPAAAGSNLVGFSGRFCHPVSRGLTLRFWWVCEPGQNQRMSPEGPRCSAGTSRKRSWNIWM